MEDKIKQVIVVRKDLNMRKGKIAAQVAHAAMKFIVDELNNATAFGGLEFTDEEIKWMTGSLTKICVGVDSEEEINDIIQKAESSGIRTKKIIDNGNTEFRGTPTLTCVAIGPDYSSKIDLITKELKCL